MCINNWTAYFDINMTVADVRKETLLPSAQYMMDTAQSIFKKVKFLSAIGTVDPYANKERKVKLIESYFPDIDVIFTIRTVDKAKFASPQSILIDDKIKAVKAFHHNNGNSILHQSSLHTMKIILESI